MRDLADRARQLLGGGGTVSTAAAVRSAPPAATADAPEVISAVTFIASEVSHRLSDAAPSSASNASSSV